MNSNPKHPFRLEFRDSIQGSMKQVVVVFEDKAIVGDISTRTRDAEPALKVVERLLNENWNELSASRDQQIALAARREGQIDEFLLMDDAFPGTPFHLHFERRRYELGISRDEFLKLREERLATLKQPQDNL
jgi:hypothetical protein